MSWAMEEKDYSQRRACVLAGIEPKTYRYRRRRQDGGVSDALADGRRFRVLGVVDDFTRECLSLVADTSLSGARLARELDAVIAARGKPAMVVSDNGTELTSTAILRWQQETGVA